VESQAAERNRLLKLLESANIKLASVATDVFGTSGRLMLRALIAGKATAQEMAELARRKLRSKIPQLQLALEGKLEGHHRFLLKLQLDRLERAEGDLAVLEQRIQEKLEPYAAQLALLREIPGVDWTLAAVIIAELGVDMSVFQSVSQLASWAGVCPGNNESAGKRKSSRIPKGNVYLKTALVEAAMRRLGRKAPTCETSFTVSRRGVGISVPWWRSAIRSWYPSITWSPKTSPTTISATSTWISSIRIT